MNIVQQHEKVRFLVDAVASPRFDAYDIDNALNLAISQYVDEMYSGNNVNEDSFQKTQRLRDILGPLVKKAPSSVLSTLYIDLDGLEYRHLLSLKVTANNISYPCYPLTYDQINEVSFNPYRRVRSTLKPKAYYTEEEGKLRVIMPSGITGLSGYELYYLANPDVVNYGIERSSIVILIEDVAHIATVTPTSYSVNGNPFDIAIGEEYTPPVVNVILIAGKMVFGFTNCNLRSSSHEEIAYRASLLLMKRPIDLLRNKQS